MASNNHQFLEASEHWLELFDEKFSAAMTPIHLRPLQASIQLVSVGIESVANGTLEDFWTQEWFAVIVHEIRQWYGERYGQALCDPPTEFIGGIVCFRGAALRLDIPSTLSRVEIPGETAWILLPNELLPEEDVAALFRQPPNLDGLEAELRDSFLTDVKNVVRWSRSIQLNLSTASELGPSGSAMAAGIWRHFEKAVSDIQTLKAENVSVACWELHLAVEKSFKVFLLEHGVELFKHELELLHPRAEKLGLVVSEELLGELPSAKEAIENRYGKMSVDLHRCMRIYMSALQLAFEISEQLQREITLHNAAFLIKRPHWVKPGT